MISQPALLKSKFLSLFLSFPLVFSSGNDDKLHYELDLLSEAAGEGLDKRLARLEISHPVVAGNDNSLAREIELLLLAGRSDRALELLRSHHFHAFLPD